MASASALKVRSTIFGIDTLNQEHTDYYIILSLLATNGTESTEANAVDNVVTQLSAYKNTHFYNKFLKFLNPYRNLVK